MTNRVPREQHVNSVEVLVNSIISADDSMVSSFIARQNRPALLVITAGNLALTGDDGDITITIEEAENGTSRRKTVYHDVKTMLVDFVESAYVWTIPYVQVQGVMRISIAWRGFDSGFAVASIIR